MMQRAAELHIGEKYMKNVCKVNEKEPDPKGYMRTINSIDFADKTETIDGVSVTDCTVKIDAKAFLWAQIRILVMNLLRCSLKD